MDGTFGVASASRVSGTVASTPGNSPSGVPPLISTCTRGHAGHGSHRAHDLVEPRQRGVGGVALHEARAEIDDRDVAGIVTLRTSLPGGTYVRNDFAVSAVVGPAISALSASCTVAPGRSTATSCSPCPKNTLTVGAAGALPVAAAQASNTDYEG